MKLRNLLFGTMIACAFVACSNDDDPINNGPDEINGTVLRAQADAPLATRAAGDDEAINSLTILVFSNNALEVVGDLKSANVTEASNLVAGTKDVLVMANLPAATITELKGQVGKAETTVLASLEKTLNAENAEEAASSLTMNSKLYKGITLTPNVINYLGWKELPGDGKLVGGITDATAKVQLYRNAAKVVLSILKVKANMEEGDRFPNPALQVKSIFILQGSAKTYLVGYEGTDTKTFGKEYGSTEVSNGGYLAGTTHVSADNDDFTVVGGADIYDKYKVENKSLISYTTPDAYIANESFYVYENTDATNQTLLVVEGDFSYDTYVDGKVVRNEDNKGRYYTVALGVTDANFNNDQAKALLALRGVTADAANGVYRNLQYNVKLTVAGPGYQTPTHKGDPTVLDAQVEVVAYGYVDQDVTIE